MGTSFPIERMMSSHSPLEIRNMMDEHEAQAAPNHGGLGFPKRGRNILIEAVRGERTGRKLKQIFRKSECV